MNLSFKHFRAFVAVANHMHFGLAASEVGVSQPSLTLTIQQLEAALGTQLLVRSTRKVSLTDMGQEFLHQAVRVVNDVDAAVCHVRDFVELRKGTINIGSLPSAAVNVLPHVFKNLHRSFPEIKIAVHDGTTNAILRNLISGKIDFALTSKPKTEPELNFIPLYDERVSLLLPVAHHLAGKPSIAWAEIINEEIVAVSDQTGVRQLVDEKLAERGMRIKAIIEPNSMQTVLAMTAAGLGPGIVLAPYPTGSGVNGLENARATDPKISRTVGFLHRATYRPTPVAQKVMDLISQYVSDDGFQALT